ncbi:MAG: tripartite tricarboxylate transporter permease [Nanoarchaeota archaeon]
MLGELFIATLAGIILGLIAALMPGIHSNTISAIMLAVSPALLYYLSPLAIAAAIISMGICQSFLDCIPSIFLGAPEADTALSVLPGHKLLLEGKGCEAILLSASGCFFALIFSIAFTIPTIWLFTFVYPLIKDYIGWMILAVVVYLIAKDTKKLWSISIFIASGILGWFTLNMHALKEPLMPLLSGLFGVSMLLLSLETNTKIPKQDPPKLELKKDSIKHTITASFTGWLCAFMPGLGPSQGAIITSQFTKTDTKSFLFLMGGIGAANFVVSLVTLYAIQKARNGAVVAVSQIVESFGAKELFLLMSISLLVGGISMLIASPISKAFAGLIVKVKYSILCTAVIAIIIGGVIALSGALGLLVLFASTSMGMVANIKGIRKSNMMGCLLVPVLIYFLL